MTQSDIARASHHRRASRLWHLATGAILVAVIAAWLLPSDRPSLGPAAGGSGPRAHPYRVKWNGPITPSAAGLIIAQSDGLFAREGISITLEGGGSDDDVTNSVAANDFVIGHITASGFLRARASGAPIVAFASSYTISSVELYALSITSLNAPSDLAGKTIGYNPSNDTGITIEALMRMRDVPRSQIKVAATQVSVTDLLHGRIDVLAGNAQAEGEELRSLKIPFRTLNPAAFGVHSIGTVYITSEQALARQPDLAERFLAALIQGWDAAYGNYDRTIPIITQFTDPNLAPAGVASFMDRQRAYIRPYGTRMGELDLARWRDLQDRLLGQRLISQPIDLKQAVMFSIVPELYRTRLKALAIN